MTRTKESSKAHPMCGTKFEREEPKDKSQEPNKLACGRQVSNPKDKPRTCGAKSETKNYKL